MIIVGCPIYKREWILPHWLKAIENQDYPLDQLGFVFITAPEDEATLKLLLEFSERHPEIKCFDIEAMEESHRDHSENHREWSGPRYMTMVSLRNRLLARVRCHEPDKFFSLDSDILLENPRTISILDTLTDSHDAVAPLMFMTPVSNQFPSVMTWHLDEPHKAHRRDNYPLGTFFEADVIMAAVMQSKSVYQNVNYAYHKQGEDLGWSKDAANKGYKLYSASYLYCPHVMSPLYLSNYLVNGDSLCLRSSYVSPQ